MSHTIWMILNLTQVTHWLALIKHLKVGIIRKPHSTELDLRNNYNNK